MSGDGDPITGCSAVGDDQSGVGATAAADHLGDPLVDGLPGMGGHDGQAAADGSDVGGNGVDGGDRVAASGAAGKGEAGDHRVVGGRPGLLGDVVAQWSAPGSPDGVGERGRVIMLPG